MALFHTIRLVSFATILFFSLIVLGIAGHWTSLLQGTLSTFTNFSAFALAVSVITWAFIAPLLLIGMLRKGSLLSWVGVEAGIVGLHWVLWLSSAAYSSSVSQIAIVNCDYTLLSPEAESLCRQNQALQAFSWLNWIILTIYLVLLLVFAIKAQHNGHSVWTADVNDMDSFKAGGSTNTSTKHEPAYQQNNQYNPSMQQNSLHPNSAQV
ncbi:hypothetical protein BDV93DRAFT_519702 [Ceratobasidium sp. AG-I]|nr:hypothetical protein BDV93DRAFT_519702 [Ceratobasidium sp. AG-I]